MRWNLRMTAAERGIWKSTEMRRRLAEAGLEISAGKMSALWTGTPTTIRLDDLDVICAVLECDADALLIREPGAVAARRPQRDRPRRRNGARRLSRQGSGHRSPNRRFDAPPAALLRLSTQPGRVVRTSSSISAMRVCPADRSRPGM